MLSVAVPQYDIPERRHHLAVFDGSYLSGIPQFISEWHLQRIVLVGSKTLYSKTSYIQDLQAALGPKLVGSKIGVGPHSPYADVIAIAHLLQSSNADGVICIGSCSYTDAAKIASKLSASLKPGFTAADMEGTVDQSKGHGILKEASVKVILIPTSLSAAEWNGTGSCTNSKGKKQHYGLGNMREGAADLVFCDPILASTAPESLWLSSGVRCVDHCVETICNRYCTPEAEQNALDGLEEMLKGLAEYTEGAKGDRERFLHGISNAQKGSRRSIQDIVINRNSGGPSHAIGHQLGSVAGVSHGVTSCVLLAPTLRYTAVSDDANFERSRTCQPKILQVFNRALGWQENNVSDALVKFFKQLGLPTSLGEVHVTEEEVIDRVAEATLTDIWGGGERQISDKREVRKILDMAR